MDKIKEAIDELKEELLRENLKGKDTWTEDTKLAFTLTEIKRLQKRIDHFNNITTEMREKLESKISNMRENWKIDESLSEIEKMKETVKFLMMKEM